MIDEHGSKILFKAMLKNKIYNVGDTAYIGFLQHIVDKKDWPEDFSGDNGMYDNKCRVCQEMFTGHKRRVVCKICQQPRNCEERTNEH